MSCGWGVHAFGACLPGCVWCGLERYLADVEDQAADVDDQAPKLGDVGECPRCHGPGRWGVSLPHARGCASA